MTDSIDTIVTDQQVDNLSEITPTPAKKRVNGANVETNKTSKKRATNKKTAKKEQEQSTNNTEPLNAAYHINQCVQELNKSYYHVIIGGKNRIMRMISADVGTGLQPEFFTLEEFKQKWSHSKKVFTGIENDKPVMKSKGVVWLNSPDANFIDGSLDFDPAQPPLTLTKKCRLNIWQGFGVKQASIPIAELIEDEQLSQYMAHIKDVICAGNDTNYKYLVGYIAHMVQKPWEKPSVAVILKAGQGVGKGTFMAPLITIMGAHGLATTNSKDVVGRFNAALESKILTFFDEAFAGSKEASDMLKGLISEIYMRIERKGIDSIRVPNKMRIFMASNSENIVIVESDDRRYFFLSVSEKNKQDKDYFSERAYMQQSHPDHHQFAEKLLQYLLTIDISNFDPHHAPVTDELVRQKIDSLKPEERWVFHILRSGGLTKTGSNIPKWPEWKNKDDCYQHCITWLETRKLKPSYGDYEQAIGRALNKAGIKSDRKQIVGERVVGRSFPSLKKARKNFEKSMKGEIDWD